MPDHAYADNDVLTASVLNTNVRNQVIATVTSGTRPTGTEGQLIYETDTDRFQAHTGVAFVEFGKLGAWEPWVVTLSQSVGVTYTTNHAAYMRFGNLIIANCNLTVTGTGSAGGAVSFSAPVTAVSANAGWGTGFVRDTSATALVAGLASLQSATTIQLRDATQSTNALLLGQTSSAFAAALANGDTVGCGIIYEAA